MISPVVPALTFLANGGNTGALMRAHDWSQSLLGSPESWPQSLRSVVGMMLNSMFPMFIAWGPELCLLYNDAYVEILGAKHPAALGRRFVDVWPEVWSDLLPNIEQAMSGHAVYYANLPLTLLRKSYEEPAWFTFSYSPLRDETGDVAGMFCACIETTEQVLAERHRVEEVKHLQKLFQQAPGIIAVLKGPTHIFDIANEAYCELIGRHDIIGEQVREVVPEVEGQGFFELLDDVYSTGVPFFGNEVGIMLQRSSDGPLEERFVSFIYQPTHNEFGEVSGIFVEGSDVTESVRAKQALQRSENELKASNRRKDEFLAMLAHELRNPLAPIATAAAILRMGSLDATRVRKTSEVITRQVEHMTELVDDLLDVSRVTRGLVVLEYEILNIGDVLANATEQVRSLMEAKRQSFTVQLPEEQLFVRGDRTRLIQIFSNIINNAAKYTPEEGHIALTVDADEKQVIVAIIDDGVGIASTLLPHIFDLFTQAERSPDRSQGGLGLGLALVKSLLELQGGKVVAQSAGQGQGSRFTVWLPRMATFESRSDVEEERSLPTDATKTRVLIVDDNKDAAETLQLLLQASGHEALLAYCANDALSVAREKSPAVLFLDIGLPDMDGYELARRLRSLPETAGSLLIAMTGYGQEQDKRRGRDAGFDHHLVKPAKPEEVLRLVSGKQR